MSIWDVCIRRPVFTTMLVLGPIVLGLASFDLPDCYRALEAKKLKQVEPWGASGASEVGVRPGGAFGRSLGREPRGPGG